MKPLSPILILLFTFSVVYAQNVTNVSFHQEGNKVIILYDLDVPSDVSVFMSTDGGVTYGDTLRHVTGAVGKNVPAGTGKRIEYDPLAELDKLQGDNFVFKVSAVQHYETKEEARLNAKTARLNEKNIRLNEKNVRLNSIPKSVFLTVNAELWNMPQWGLGFKVGTMKNVGWYFSFLTNFNYNGMFRDFYNGSEYDLTGNSKTSYIEAMAGITARRYKLLSFHFGVGFNYRTNLLQTTQGWYRYEYNTYYGPVVATGLMFHINSIVISLEGTTAFNVNNQSYYVFSFGGNLGVGYSFPTKTNNKTRK